MSSLRNQSGQAMTEMVVTSSMILIPLFLLIPLLGKYIDINHSTIQAARYEAWEYSVWYRSSNNTPTGVENEKGRQVQLPIKRFQDIEHEAKQRFFTKQKTQIKRNVRRVFPSRGQERKNYCKFSTALKSFGAVDHFVCA